VVSVFRRSLCRLLLIVAAIIRKRKKILSFLSANVHLEGSYLDGEVESLGF
jgi:hypothetical protein